MKTKNDAMPKPADRVSPMNCLSPSRRRQARPISAGRMEARASGASVSGRAKTVSAITQRHRGGELTPEQARYIGVPKQGPYKPDTYRY